MNVEFIFSAKVTECETKEELKKENKEDAVLLGYCEAIEKTLSEGEKRFPSFAEGPGSELSIFLVTDEEIRETNMETRKIDKATDVLSFPFLELREGDGRIDMMDLNPDNGRIMLGDIMISLDKVREQAKEYGHAETREIAFLACHGFLHLMGYDHMEAEEEKRMMTLAEDILKEAGYTR